MADQGGQQREIVFCHACSNEWLRDQHGLQCPECHSDAVEIVSLPQVKLIYLTVKGYNIVHKTYQALTSLINRSMSVMIHETITLIPAMITMTTVTMMTVITRLP